NVALGDDESAYFTASVGGKVGVLMSLDVTGPNWIRDAFPNIKQIASSDASTIVGMQDFDFDAGGKHPAITSPGGLVFMSLRESDKALVRSGGYKASIRRPCNVSH